jgi:hypothetical protein
VAGPCFVDVDETGADEAQEHLVVGEYPDLDGTALEFLVDSALDRVRGAQTLAVVLRQADARPSGMAFSGTAPNSGAIAAARGYRASVVLRWT